MTDVFQPLCAEHGVFLRREALQLGYDDRSLARLIRVGDIHRVKHGVYALGSHWDSANERERFQLLGRAAVRTSKRPVALSHSSGVLEYTNTYWDLDLSEAQVTRLDARSGRRGSKVGQHRGLVLPGDVRSHGGVQVMSPERAALELTTMTDIEHSLVSINGLLRQGACTIESLKERAAGMRYWPHTLTTDLTLSLADRRIASAGETRTYYLCWRQGIPCPIPQYEIRDGRGQVVATVDFAWPEYGVFLEFDGKIKYLKLLRDGESPSDVVFREKKREDLIRRITQWRAVRLVWADLYTPELTGSRIWQVLRNQPAA